MPEVDELCALLEPAIVAEGFELVRLRFFEGTSRTLQIMAEDPATGSMTIDACARLSAKISAILDEEDPIDGEYALEVSSPGIDRPLTRLKDFRNWTGHLARIELKARTDLNGLPRKRLKGTLAGVDGEEILVNVRRLGDLRLPFDTIQKAELVLTEALIAATKNTPGNPKGKTPGAPDAEEHDREEA